jgi:hypothetical protein
MRKENNSGIKNFIRAIVALVMLIFLFNFSTFSKELGVMTTILICLTPPILVLLITTETVKSIKYDDNKFVVYKSSLTSKSELFFSKEDVEKVEFHGKRGQYDAYWIKIYFKNTDAQTFNLPFEPKEIFPVIDKFKEKGFSVVYV